MYIPQPSITLFGIRVDEPVTTLTDLFVALVCFYAFYRLTNIQTRNKVHTYLKVYFMSMGLATLIGGLIGHGFLYLFEYRTSLPVSPWKLPGWIMSMLSIAMIERASIKYAEKLIKPKVGRLFAWINIIELSTFMIITFSTLNFFFVEVHSAYGLLIVVSSFNGYVYYKTKSKGSRYFLIAVGFSALSALVFMNEWGLHIWFNYFDISHCIMTIGAYFFYRGALEAINDPFVSKV